MNCSRKPSKTERLGNWELRISQLAGPPVGVADRNHSSMAQFEISIFNSQCSCNWSFNSPCNSPPPILLKEV